MDAAWGNSSMGVNSDAPDCRCDGIAWLGSSMSYRSCVGFPRAL